MKKHALLFSEKKNVLIESASENGEENYEYTVSFAPFRIE